MSPPPVREVPTCELSGQRTDRSTVVSDLVNSYGDDVLGFCLRMLGDRSQAEDVAQQVFLEACRDLQRAEIRSTPRSWLFGIANHRCLDLIRRRRRTQDRVDHSENAMSGHADPGVGPAERLERAQLIAALEHCLRRLSPEVRATVLLRFQSGATYQELATHLEASAEALQVRVTRALPLLRRCLNAKGWHGE